jgi:polyhydroxybutyrate depolymerase
MRRHMLGLRASALSLGLGLVLLVSGAACSGTAATAAATDAGADASVEPSPLIVERPYAITVPTTYDAAKPMPLVLAFHGYGDGDDGKLVEKYFKLAPVAEEKGFLYVAPDGTMDKDKQRFWNGTDACCDFQKSGVDDVAYVKALIEDVAAHYNVDRKRIYATGVSGGGIFAHRLACDMSETFAAVLSLSGATFADASRCKPTSPLSIAEVHGDKDDVVVYEGGTLTYGKIDAAYPSAKDTVAHWAAYSGCSGALEPTGTTLDLASKIPGAETKVERYAGCSRGDVELWTIAGGPHAPLFNPEWGRTIWSFFDAHAKP